TRSITGPTTGPTATATVTAPLPDPRCGQNRPCPLSLDDHHKGFVAGHLHIHLQRGPAVPFSQFLPALDDVGVVKGLAAVLSAFDAGGPARGIAHQMNGHRARHRRDIARLYGQPGTAAGKV